MATGMRALLDTVMQALPQVNMDSVMSQPQKSGFAFFFSYLWKQGQDMNFVQNRQPWKIYAF